MQRNRPLAQHYELYTQEDFTVWRMLYEKQMGLLAKYASHYYLDALKKVQFRPDAIPNFKDLNNILGKITGWQLTVVPELVPTEKFFTLLSKKTFPATCWLRTMAEIEYIEEPDMFHDVFGHVPLLANEQYAMFMQAFGTLALQWMGQPAMIDIFSRLYWFTIEFGLIRENDDTKIYGAGILSSPGETLHSMSDSVVKDYFNIETVLSTAYRNDVMQDRYFIIQSFEQLYHVLPAAEQFLMKMNVAVQ
jgi:phenylalanine-4-hydroxylase